MDVRIYRQLREIERQHWWFQGRRAILLAALERAGVEAESVLDCGCGAGSNMEVLSVRFPDSSIYGLDIQREPLEFLREDRGVPACQGDAIRLPFRSEALDLVSALDTIEHVEHDSVALAELMRVCRPGGTLFLSVPAFPFLWGNIDQIGHHYRRYSRAQLIERVEDAGFEVQFVRYFNFLLFVPIAVLRVLARLLPKRRNDDETLKSDFDIVKEGPLNRLLAALFSLEASMLGFRAPFGVSLLLLARRPLP